MPTTRSSTASKGSSESASAGTKRSAEASSSAAPKRTKSTKKGGKKQKTIDETINGAAGSEDLKETKQSTGGEEEKKSTTGEAKKEYASDGASKAARDGEANGSKVTKSESQQEANNANSHPESEANEKTQSIQTSTTSTSTSKSSSDNSILEKGLIYFFFKPRVNNSSPSSISDVARTHFILRPLPLDSPLNKATLEKASTVRMLALPKKTFPKSKRDRFLTFVEKGRAGIEEVREGLVGGEYETKTKGTSHQDSARPFAEGIYTLLLTNRTSHLAYHITTPSPSSPSEIQTELGLAEKGSFVVSVKNPEAPAPASANASYMKPAAYPKELQDRFEGRRWGACESAFLDVVGTQVLLIGEGWGDFGKEIEGAVEGNGEGEKDVEEAIEKLEDEDHDRVENLKEDDPVFADLGLSSKEFEGLQTTW